MGEGGSGRSNLNLNQLKGEIKIHTELRSDLELVNRHSL